MKMDILTTSYNTNYLYGMNDSGSSSGYYVCAKKSSDGKTLYWYKKNSEGSASTVQDGSGVIWFYLAFA